MAWTDERVEVLKKMWMEGKSASQIAKELGGVTRNAVIGKVHRLGLSNRATTKAAPKTTKAKETSAKPAAKPAPAKKVAAETALPANTAKIPPRKPIVKAGQPLPPQPSANEISQEVLSKAAEVIKKAKRLHLMDLTEKTCKWPVGDPATDDFWFCGLTAEVGKPYCEAHSAVAYQPMSTRKDRRSR